MTLLVRILRSRAVITLVTVAVLLGGWNIYLAVRAPSRVGPALEEQVDRGLPVRVAVELGFPAERFHTLELQQYGRVSGVDGNVVELRDVRPGSVNAIARIYWVDHVDAVESPSP